MNGTNWPARWPTSKKKTESSGRGAGSDRRYPAGEETTAPRLSSSRRPAEGADVVRQLPDVPPLDSRGGREPHKIEATIQP